MIKGAVFDMDGLMFDTEKLVYQAWQRVMDSNGYDYDFEIYKKTVGRRTAETRKFYEELYGGEFDYQRLRNEANVFFRDDIETNGVPLKKGLVNILEYLKTHNIKIALATSTSSATAMGLLEKANVKQYFDRFVCGNMVKNGKPHPEVFLTAAKELCLKPESCIALEDSINGIKSAYNAGMKPLMVPDLLEPTEEIKPMLFALCKDLDEAIEYFKQ
ncbi:MAG: HAD family phosphatase [Oscillospiraceae bacterium]|nr:HAD family phosphatase [Oscillospiraceae bacterium]